MSDTTDRFLLPFIAPGQAQKELFHNEALVRVDALLHPVAEAIALDAPPASPVPGQCWIVGPAPTGAWDGQALALAIWTEGGWRFVVPQAGMTVWSAPDALPVRFDGSTWQLGEVRANRIVVGGHSVVGAQQSAIASPTGGSTIDAEARTAIGAALSALRAHGLIAS